MTYTKKQAMQLTGNERVIWLADRLGGDYSDGDVFEMCRYANSYDGSFDFTEAYDLEELITDMGFTGLKLARAIVYGNVENVTDPVRFDGYGNLETVSEWDLRAEALEHVAELAALFVEDSGTVDRDMLYQDEQDVLEGWDALDDCDDDERDEVLAEILSQYV